MKKQTLTPERLKALATEAAISLLVGDYGTWHECSHVALESGLYGRQWTQAVVDAAFKEGCQFAEEKAARAAEQAA